MFSVTGQAGSDWVPDKRVRTETLEQNKTVERSPRDEVVPRAGLCVCVLHLQHTVTSRSCVCVCVHVHARKRREARRGEKKPEDVAFVPITDNPFRESGAPLAAPHWLLTALLTPPPPPQTHRRGEGPKDIRNFHLPFVLSATHQTFSNENVLLFSPLEEC